MPAPLGNISGTYDTEYSKFHVRQQGTALVGCYEYNEGLLDGAIEGRLMKLTWREGENSGPAVMVFSPDGKSFRGYWWRQGQERRQPGGNWDGSKISAQVGGCPHWSGSLGGELKKQLTCEGRARVYGILFDLNSATIKAESKPVLEEVLGLLQGEPSWKLTIEGHTDSTGSPDFNQKLSLQRADAVKAYLLGRRDRGRPPANQGFRFDEAGGRQRQRNGPRPESPRGTGQAVKPFFSIVPKWGQGLKNAGYCGKIGTRWTRT